MRLLDFQVARKPSRRCCSRWTSRRRRVASQSPVSRTTRRWQMSQCPLQGVAACSPDDLTHAAAHLLRREGEPVCKLPGSRAHSGDASWVEWSDEIHKKVYVSTCRCGGPTSMRTRAAWRVGISVPGTGCGRLGVLRTFWSEAADRDSLAVTLSPIETHIDLRDVKARGADKGGLIDGGFGVRVADERDPAMDSLLDCARFRFDARWAAYYREAARTEESRHAAVNGSLSAVARDVPLLLAFFLLLNARDATSSVRIGRETVNGKRRRLGRAPLLDHIEVRASLDRLSSPSDSEPGHRERRAPGFIMSVDIWSGAAAGCSGARRICGDAPRAAPCPPAPSAWHSNNKFPARNTFPPGAVSSRLAAKPCGRHPRSHNLAPERDAQRATAFDRGETTDE